MSQNIKLLAIIAFMSLGAWAGNAQTPQTSSRDEAAIRRVIQQVQDAWNAHDAKTAAAVYDIDADYVNVNGTYRKGREAIENGYAAIFSTIYKESHNTGAIKNIRFLRPDVAVIHAEWNLKWRAKRREKVMR